MMQIDDGQLQRRSDAPDVLYYGVDGTYELGTLLCHSDHCAYILKPAPNLPAGSNLAAASANQPTFYSAH